MDTRFNTPAIRVSSVFVSENWAVTQLEELAFKYTWRINNFALIKLKEDGYINSPILWPSGNKSFELKFSLHLSNRNMQFYLNYRSNDQVHINYLVAVGPNKFNDTETLEKNKSVRLFYIEDDLDIFKNYGNLTIYCEIHALYKIVQNSGKKLDQCTSMQTKSVESKLSSNLLDLLENEKFSDITIIVENNEIRAHKNI
ncbi:hypothetical protein TSAR_011604 [Trichomalopsis sarcophagae]|uniref:BTB domain-containing protein n=1 Tax=Trichomalopsis sarcophagae TaxID=543379 RepID=A0A232EQ07_9HYME|nr:hypothetical protein TSAR_011604 [Trichomalopsis sarcophagae]